MPKLPLAAEDALKSLPVLGELNSQDYQAAIKARPAISAQPPWKKSPALHEVRPGATLYVPGRAWRTFLAEDLRATRSRKTWQPCPTRLPRSTASRACIPALFGILAGRAEEIEAAPGLCRRRIRFHHPLIVPSEPEKCWIEIGGHHFH